MAESKPGMMKRIGKGTLIYTADCPLNCLAVSPKAEVLAVAGRSLFQVFTIHEDKFVSLPRSKTPSRLFGASSGAGFGDATITSGKSQLYDTTGSSGPAVSTTTVQPSIQTPRSHSVTDVAWSCADDILATGSTGGDITLWDVSHNMAQITCFSGHIRSIHCITFHPTNPSELISASQDGTLKLFDTRDPLSGTAQRTFKWSTTSSSPFRDVAYSPRNPNLIAAAQENGMVSIWDTRQHARPVRGFQGHTCSVATLDWHPNWQGSGRNWLATAGAGDHLIKVWNFDQPAPGQSSCPLLLCSVRTSNVSRVRWRPSFTTQLVSSCNQTFDLSAYLWDLRRPYLPYASFEEHKGIVTSIAWSPCETNHFYTVGRDCLLIRHCVADGLRPAESASPVALSINVRGALAHAVSRDRVLASQPPPVVDETNLVTQSPYYRALKSSSSLFSAGDASSANFLEGPPGFYAAPSSVELTDGFPDNSHLQPQQQQQQQQQSLMNLPPMGSPYSAELFVSQAQSLLFYLEPSPESLCHPDGMRLSSALLPDLIIALAKHYEFIGPSVDRICAHNAAVALRFGQSFLVQFWSMLRSIYGHIPIDSEVRKLSMQSLGHGSATAKANSAEPDENGVSDKMATTGACEPADPTNGAAAGGVDGGGGPVNISSTRFDQAPTTLVTEDNRYPTTGEDPPNASDRPVKAQSGIFLSDICNALGLSTSSAAVSRVAVPTTQRAASPSTQFRRVSVDSLTSKLELSHYQQAKPQPSQVSFNPSVVSGREHSSGMLDSTTLWNNLPVPHTSLSLPKCTRPIENLIPPGEVNSPRGTPPPRPPPQHAVSHHIAIHRKRGTDSLSERPKPSSHSPQPISAKLGVSVSSAHTCDSLGEPVDFLLHYAQLHAGAIYGSSAVTEAASTADTSETDGAEKSCLMAAREHDSDQDADLIGALGAPDDPVILENPFLPDEAFYTRHPIEQNLYDSLTAPRFDVTSDRRRSASIGRTSAPEHACATPQPGMATATPRQRALLDRLMTLNPQPPDTHGTQQWIRKVQEHGLKRGGLKPQLEITRDPSGVHRGHISVNEKQHVDVVGRSPDAASGFNQLHSHETDSRDIQLLAPFNPSLNLMCYGQEPTVFNSVTTPYLPDATPLVAQWLYDLVEYGHVQTACTALLALGPERLRLSEWINEARVESWFTSYLELLSRFRLWTVSARIIKQCGSSRGGVDTSWQLKDMRRAMTLQGATRPHLGRTQGDGDGRKSSASGDAPPRMRWRSGGAASGGSSTPGAAAANNNTTGHPGAGIHSANALASNVAALNQASTTLSVRCGRCSKPLHANEATQRLTGHAGWACSRHSTTADPANVTCALCHLTVRGLFVWCRGCSHGGHLEHMQAWLSQRSECPAGCGHHCEYG